MSSAGQNLPENRDFNSLYKHDAGWIPDSRVATVGDAPKETAGGALTLAPVDANSLTRSAGAPLALRLLHPGTRSDAGDRWWYATFRAGSKVTSRGFTVNDVPLGGGTAGNARLWDSTAVTASQADAGVSTGAAVVLPSFAGSTDLLEAAGYSRTPVASTDAMDGLLSLRVSKLDRTTRLPPTGLGCWGVGCQPAPVATPLTLSCASAPGGVVTAAVPVSEMSFPVVFEVKDASLAATAAATAAAGVTALLCLPAGSAAAPLNVSLAGYEAFPTAEALTGSSLTRGNAFYSAVRASATCWYLAFTLPAGASKHIAASARWAGGAPWASAASAPPALTLTVSCASVATGSTATVYGPPLAVYNPFCVYLDFGGPMSFFYDGTYCQAGMVNGLYQYDDTASRYQATWQAGSWYLWVWGSRVSSYLTQVVSTSLPARVAARVADRVAQKLTLSHFILVCQYANMLICSRTATFILIFHLHLAAGRGQD